MPSIYPRNGLAQKEGVVMTEDLTVMKKKAIQNFEG
jgi:hypothetical protein